MNSRLVPNFDAVIALEQSDVDHLRGLTMAERAELIEAACAGTVELEVSRARMGLPPSTPAPWPESTWTYLAEWTRRATQPR